MIQTTVYKPNKYKGKDENGDTLICNCEVELSWDDVTPLDQRVHQLTKFNLKCKYHSVMSDSDAFSNILRGSDQTGTWNVLTVMRYSPDTCKCQLNLLIDNIEVEAKRQAGGNATELPVIQSGRSESYFKCKNHRELFDHKAQFETVKDENKTKNDALSYIKENISTQTVTKINDDGLEYKEFAPGKQPEWNFDTKVVGKGRVLLLNVPSMSALERTQFKTHCDSTFGIGKVVVIP